jgi:hypothetical protein
VPKRTVPQLCAMPASGICWSSTDQRGITLSWQPSGPSNPFSFPSRRLCGSVL